HGGLRDATQALGFDDEDVGLSAERVDLDGEAPLDLLLHDESGDVIYWARGGGFQKDADTVTGHAGKHHTQLNVTTEQQTILDYMSLVNLDDGDGHSLPTIRLTGVNLQVVNGLGATNGYPTDPEDVSRTNTAVNGLGNIIIGYHENSFSPVLRT